jgi:predicted transcriptional regulator
MIKQAKAIMAIALASYISTDASISLPCSIIKRAMAVIAINKGNVIGILLLA